MKRKWSLAVLALVLLLGGCARPAASPTAIPMVVTAEPTAMPTLAPPAQKEYVVTFEETSCPMKLPEGAVESENIVCGYVDVPEVHADPEGKTIRLAVAVVKSTGDGPAAEPLVMLAGGPGQSALTVFTPILFMSPWEDFRADRDVVLIEQRGTRYSEPFLYCDEVADLKEEIQAQDLSYEERKPLYEAATSQCRDRLTAEGVNLGAYNSLENAADMVAVLQALGYERASLYGGSYGSMLAQHLMRDYPDVVRSVILDAVAPLRHEPNTLYKAHSTDRALRLLFERCASDPTCNETYPDLEKLFFETVARLDEEPATVQLVNLETGEPNDMLLTGERLVSMTRDFLYASSLLPYLPKMISDAAAGDYSLIRSVQSQLQGNFNQMADGMYKSVLCSEIVDFTIEDMAETDELYPEVAQVIVELIAEVWLDPCEVWEVEPLDDAVKTSVVSDIPTLVLCGEFDPTVPPAMGDVAAEKLRAAYVFAMPGLGHGTLDGGSCPVSMMLAFLDDPWQPPDAACMADMSLAFVVPPKFAELAFEPAVVEEAGIETVVPEGWLQIGPGHYAAPDGTVELAFAFEEGPAEAFLARWGSPEATAELQINGLTWTLHEIDLSAQDAGGYTAISPTDEGYYMVIALTKKEQLEDVRDGVFMPMVQAFTVAGAAADFSYAWPESQGVSPEVLQELVEIVSGYVQDDKVVGSELMVLKNRKIVLHETFGWKDRDEELAMPINTLFNIRSMTKPVMGTAIQMLMDEGKLALNDRVADYLPSFDNDASRDITVEHLLTHRSGLPLTMIAASFGEYDSLRKLADGAGERGPDFQPGSAFQYSDTGFDVLGALVEVIAGVPLQQFVQERILDPLGMADTVTLIKADDPRTERIASLYFGAQGEWSRIWSPEEEPLYPFALGSQSLYSTPLDYARFLALWMDGGRLGDEQLVSPEAVQRALTPVSDGKLPGAFPGLRLDYGQAWIVYVPEDAPEGQGERRPELAEGMALFGHSGSDGTWAWAWPNQDLMVLYFTQSRGQGTGIALEDEIDRLLIHPDRQEAEIPEELKPYLGIYTALSGPLMYKEFEILVQNGRLAVNLPEQIVVALEDADEEGLWKLTLDPSLAVSFVQDEAGEVTALQWHQAGEVFDVPRGTAPEEPPLDLDGVQKYLGAYERPEEEGSDPVEVLIHNGHLAVKTPEVAVVLELYPPDEEGRWCMRLNPVVAISFQEDEDGNVVSFTAHTPEGDFVRPKVE